MLASASTDRGKQVSTAKARGPTMLVILTGWMILSCHGGEGERLRQIAGCYENGIGPFLAEDQVAATQEGTYSPADYYELTSSRVQEHRQFPAEMPKSYTVSVHGGSATGLAKLLAKKPVWRPHGDDSLIVEWHGDYSLLQYRLKVEGDRLIGRGIAIAHEPDVKTTEISAVSARRVPCRQ